MNASKERFGAADLSSVFDDANKIVVAKGKKVVTFDMKKSPPSHEELAAAVIGRSGNLRAPAIRTGKSWLIGFHEEAYGERFK